MVVETIDFFDEEEGELPPPMSLRELVALNKAAQYEEEQGAAAAADGKPVDMQVRKHCTLFMALVILGFIGGAGGGKAG